MSEIPTVAASLGQNPVQLTARATNGVGWIASLGEGAGRDNLPLSRPSSTASAAGAPPLDPLVAEYLAAARAPNTRRAYTIDIRDFQNWGGALPSTPEQVARYLAERARTLRPSTLKRRIAALASAHHDLGTSDPTKHPLVRQVMHGIERKHGTAPRQAAPLLIEDLARIVATMGCTDVDLRDRAILLVGFFGALRRSEIVALELADLVEVERGVRLMIRKSKTDQSGKGRSLLLARRSDCLCPVWALLDWIAAAHVQQGPLFLRLDRGGVLRPLHGEVISLIVKKRTAAIGLDPTAFSGHSLRAGFVTSAMLAGADAPLIARQTGHRSQQALSAYVRPKEGLSLPSVEGG